MSQKRKQKRNKKPEPSFLWRHMGVAVLLGSVAVLLVMGMDWLRKPETMPLRAVQIEGEFRNLKAKRLEEAVADYVNDGFFGVDVDAVRAAVEALPWAYRVSVRRVWPDILRVRVLEQKALARWGKEGLVNGEGEFFAPAIDTIPQGLPMLYGPQELQQQLVRQYLTIASAAGKMGQKVTSLTQNQRRAWFMQWENGVQWKLGRADPYPRLLRFLRVYPDLLASNSRGLRSVDLRYSNGFAVQWDSQVLEEPGRPG